MLEALCLTALVPVMFAGIVTVTYLVAVLVDGEEE